MEPVYASRASMWIVVGDVLQRQYTALMPHDGGVVDMQTLVDTIDTVYETGGDETVLHQMIRESLDQLIEHKMIPDRGDKWTTQ